jgi:hypothetical protein
MIMTANQDNNNDSIMTDMIIMMIVRKYDDHNDVMILYF